MNLFNRGLAAAALSTLLLSPAAVAGSATTGPLEVEVIVNGVGPSFFEPGSWNIGLQMRVANRSTTATVGAHVRKPVLTFSDGSTQTLEGITCFDGRMVVYAPGEECIAWVDGVTMGGVSAGLGHIDVKFHAGRAGGAHSWAPGGNNHAVSTDPFEIPAD